MFLSKGQKHHLVAQLLLQFSIFVMLILSCLFSRWYGPLICARCWDLILTRPVHIPALFQGLRWPTVYMYIGTGLGDEILYLPDLHRFMHLSNDWMLYKHDLHIVWHCARCLDLILTLPAQISVSFQIIDCYINMTYSVAYILRMCHVLECHISFTWPT